MDHPQAVPGAGGFDPLRAPIGKNDLLKLHDREVEGRKVAPQARMKASASIRLQPDHLASEDCTRRECNVVVHIDGIKQTALKGLARPHGSMAGQLDP